MIATKKDDKRSEVNMNIILSAHWITAFVVNSTADIWEIDGKEEGQLDATITIY